MRYEFKYLIPSENYEALRNAVRPFLRLDAFAACQAGGFYTVRSIYFDTSGFEMYHTKVEGIAHRMKVRMRGYNIGDNNSQVFMEIKRKYEGPIQKNRSNAPYDVVRKLFEPGSSFEVLAPQIRNPDNARRFMYQIHSRNLQPVVNVIYEREPYLAQNTNFDNDFRLTFDLNLRSVSYPTVHELFEERGATYAFPGFFILELKFNQYCPNWIKPIIEDFHLRKEPASKYVGTINSNAAIDPDRWAEAFVRSRWAGDRWA